MQYSETYLHSRRQNNSVKVINMMTTFTEEIITYSHYLSQIQRLFLCEGFFYKSASPATSHTLLKTKQDLENTHLSIN